jgi:hypothetical protein
MGRSLSSQTLSGIGLRGKLHYKVESMEDTPIALPTRPPWEGAEIEYTAMRAEVLARIGLRQQILTGTLTLGGVLLGVGLQWPLIALLYPPLAAFLAVAWAQNDYRVRDLSKYIREEVEPHLPAVRWESHIHARRSGKGLGSWRIVVLAHGGLFLFTQLLGVVVGATWVSEQTAIREKIIGWGLTVSGVLAMGVVFWVLRSARR